MKLLKNIPIFLQALIYIATLLLFKVFCGFKVTGVQNVLDLSPGIIFASNHSSEWDGILIRVALPFFSRKFSPMYYVSRTKEFYDNSGWRKTLYGGLLFRMLAAYPVYKGKKDYNYSLQHYLAILGLKRNVCIFPEGRRTQDGSLGEAHGGVAFLAHTTKVPVVPVGIKGLVNLTPLDFFLLKRKVEIIFGRPLSSNTIVPQTHPTVHDYKNGGQFVLKKISDLLR